jgi:hypothetical protein
MLEPCDKSHNPLVSVFAYCTVWIDGWMISFTLTPRYTSDCYRTVVYIFRVTQTLFLSSGAKNTVAPEISFPNVHI